MIERTKIIFRADGGHLIGLGHIARCLALCEVLAKDFRVAFAIQSPDQSVEAMLKESDAERIILERNAPSSPKFKDELNNHLTGEEIVVLDGYHFSSDYEASIRKKCRAVVTINDIPDRHFAADAVINFGTGSGEDFSTEPYTHLFLGLEYVFLRSPFLRRRSDKNFNNKLFVNMGGSDPENATALILEKLIAMRFELPVVLVLGGAYQFETSLLPLIPQLKAVTIKKGLNAQEMHNTMMECAMAIVPPSTVSLEYLSTGGVAFLYQTVENQARIKSTLLSLDLALDFEEFKRSNDPGLHLIFEKFKRRQSETFNDASIARIRKVFADVGWGGQLSFRRATLDDLKLCFEWANDPDARQNSFSTEPIVWDNHVEWFKAKLADLNCIYFIAQIDGKNVGQIRFDLTESHIYRLSYMLDKDWRGKGISTFILTRGVEELTKAVPVKVVEGFVQNFNIASIKAFQRARFIKVPSTKYADSTKFALSLKPNEVHTGR